MTDLVFVNLVGMLFYEEVLRRCFLCEFWEINFSKKQVTAMPTASGCT